MDTAHLRAPLSLPPLQVVGMDDVELYAFAKSIAAPLELVREVKRLGRLPVVNFAAGGIATPADAALLMQVRQRRRRRPGCPLIVTSPSSPPPGYCCSSAWMACLSAQASSAPPTRSSAARPSSRQSRTFASKSCARGDGGPLLVPLIRPLPHTRTCCSAKVIAEVSKGLGKAMEGVGNLRESQVSFRERGH